MARRTLVLVLTLLLAVGFSPLPNAEAAVQSFRHLNPGGLPTLSERVPVNVVFVGYPRDLMSESSIRAALPSAYEPVVRYPRFYGEDAETGLTYRYAYKITMADRRYEDRLFAELASFGRPARVTTFQQLYNAQAGNSQVVTDNLEIDAPSVERWLAAHPPRGVDTTENTIFLINWFGRRDFRFHVYTKQDVADPDTGYNFGVQRDSRRLVAWGGTPARPSERASRVWFHDLSAGPEYRGGNWNVDDADLDGDDVADYRIPVAWEYGHYRPQASLTGDVVKLIRYVALDLLFTTSPLYSAALPVINPPRTLNLDVNTYQGWPGVDASSQLLKPDIVVNAVQQLLPANSVDLDNQDLPLSGKAAVCFDGWLTNTSCYPGSGYPPFANLYLQNREELERTKDDGSAVDYELPIFVYARDGAVGPYLGYADDDYRTGQQSFVFAFINPQIVQLGYGLTTTITHEVGHHVGLSHPHDGFDATSGVDFGPSGDYFFTWAGDESDSVMSYLDLSLGFSQFDRDNMHRFQTAALLAATNRLAATAINSPRSDRARLALQAADVATGVAEYQMAAHRYLSALKAAAVAYQLARNAVSSVGLDPDASASESAARRVGATRDTPHPGSVDPVDRMMPED